MSKFKEIKDFKHEDYFNSHPRAPYKINSFLAFPDIGFGKYYGVSLCDSNLILETLQIHYVQAFLKTYTKQEFQEALKKAKIEVYEDEYGTNEIVMIDWRDVWQAIQAGTLKRGSLYPCPGGGKGTLLWLPKAEAEKEIQQYESKRKQVADELEKSTKIAHKNFFDRYTEE